MGLHSLVDGSPLTFKKLVAEIAVRAEAKRCVDVAAIDALRSFAVFLRSPKIIAGLVAHKGESALAAGIGEAKKVAEVVDLLLTGNDGERVELAKVLEVVAGGKTPKL